MFLVSDTAHTMPNCPLSMNLPILYLFLRSYP